VIGGRLVDVGGPDELVAALKVSLEAGGEIQRYTHRFHSYPARTHPDAARRLIGVLGAKRLLDPFCGGGTVLVEAMARGCTAFGRDIHPIAVLVATARTRLFDAEECAALVADGRRIASEGKRHLSERAPPAVFALKEWFEPRVLSELVAIHHLCMRAPPERRLLLRALHLSLVVKYSRRASDTSQRRVSVRYPPNAVLRAYRAKAEELGRMLSALRTAVPRGTPEADIALDDARRISVPDVDLVCTSPPYPGTYDYVPLQELRLAWLATGEDVREAKAREIGARRSFRGSAEEGYERWIEDTAEWVRSAARCLSPGGHLAVLTGDGIVRGHLLDARRPTADAARKAGLRPLGSCSIERVDPATQLAKREHALVFQLRAER
jgi:SAM-dependent methyltransferase